MRIEWNGEAAQGVLRMLGEIEEILETSGREARRIRSELDELDQDGDNRRIQRIINRYEVVMERLQKTGREAEDLTKAAKRAADCFEDAEKEVYRLMNHLETEKKVQGEPGGGASKPPAIRAVGRPVNLDYVDWILPEAGRMPEMRIGKVPPADWFIALLMNSITGR